MKKKISGEVRLIGNFLLYIGICGFFFFLATSERLVDANIYYYAFLAVAGWFILQLKLWARKGVLLVLSIYAIGEIISFIFLMQANSFSMIWLANIGGGSG